MKISHKLCVRMDGTQFFIMIGLQPKMSAGIINEHECIFNLTNLSISLSGGILTINKKMTHFSVKIVVPLLHSKLF